MLSSIIASKGARLIAACVCPVVGAGTLTMAVPKVRNAVHKITAPREYALPKTRERIAQPISAPAPCTIGATPLSAGYIESLPDNARPGGPLVSYDVPGSRIDVSRSLPDDRVPPGANPPGVTPPASAVPEPHAWLQMLVGFTLIGGAVRAARKRPDENEEELLVRVEALKKDARP
jgi:hypothetical protein